MDYEDSETGRAKLESARITSMNIAVKSSGEPSVESNFYERIDGLE